MGKKLACLPFIVALCYSAGAGGQEPMFDTRRGDKLLDDYFRLQVKQIADFSLADINTRADWEKKRPELRRQFLDMLALWPLPAKTDLKATITGTVDDESFTIEKLHFQSIPGLYVTGNLYLPKKSKLPAPAILYLCGHATTMKNGVSFGNHVNYQHHPAWFAEHGYVCLILDTLQLGEVQGIHDGTSRQRNMWWWYTLGYTPAGIECWNAIRALDYLETRKEVDGNRIGVTGRSGGGATSWWVAAADDRPKCIVPVAGIADLQAHLVEGVAPRFRKGVISGHCDCMYMVNTYRWDFPMVAALCAPRPLLLGNSDTDDIFPVPGYRRLAEKVEKIYDLYNAGDRFALLETKGPHKDTPEIRHGAFRWLNRWLNDDNAEVSERDRPRFEPEQLKVLDRIPKDAINATVHESFICPERPTLPQEGVKEWWPGQQKEWMRQLREKVFRGWAEKAPPLNARPVETVRVNGVMLRAWDFTSEEGVELRVWLLTAEKVATPKLITLSAVDENGWQEWLSDLGPAFQQSLLSPGEIKLDEKKFAQNRKALEFFKWGFATVAPRGIGPTRWSVTEGTAKPPAKLGDHHIRRRFALIGQTLDGQRVWDVRRAVAVLRSEDGLKEVPLWLQGKGDMAGVALYAGLFEPDVARFDLWYPPTSHREGPILLNVRRVLDMPQALALAFPRRIMLYVNDPDEAKRWDWPVRLQRALGQTYVTIRTVGDRRGETGQDISTSDRRGTDGRRTKTATDCRHATSAWLPDGREQFVHGVH
jgi:cephalosporin-C deacetylase-like acetyl esterase